MKQIIHYEKIFFVQLLQVIEPYKKKFVQKFEHKFIMFKSGILPTTLW